MRSCKQLEKQISLYIMFLTTSWTYVLFIRSLHINRGYTLRYCLCSCILSVKQTTMLTVFLFSSWRYSPCCRICSCIPSVEANDVIMFLRTSWRYTPYCWLYFNTWWTYIPCHCLCSCVPAGDIYHIVDYILTPAGHTGDVIDYVPVYQLEIHTIL